MKGSKLEQIVDGIVESDARYKPAAYFFLQEALEATMKAHQLKMQLSANEHISGQDLLQGIREYALEQFGPMTTAVFSDWGISKCEDFGEIVYNLIEAGVLGKTDEESKADFRACYDFKTAFEKPFLPTKKQA
jgi:uncharacterized repeat protein (TIGR04138 family)